MRESIGATWIFSICLTFIVLFTAYLAISVNYAKSFRIKSDIISMIEENEGYNSDMDYNIEQYLLAQAYNANGYCETTLTARDDLHSDWVRESCINISGDTIVEIENASLAIIPEEKFFEEFGVNVSDTTKMWELIESRKIHPLYQIAPDITMCIQASEKITENILAENAINPKFSKSNLLL